MDAHQSEALAKGLLAGEISIEQFVSRVTSPATATLADARIDLDRIDRCGIGEVVFGEGKTVDALRSIIRAMRDRGQGVLITRLDEGPASELLKDFADGVGIPGDQCPFRTFDLQIAPAFGVGDSLKIGIEFFLCGRYSDHL